MVVCAQGPSPGAARFRFRARSSGARPYRSGGCPSAPRRGSGSARLAGGAGDRRSGHREDRGRRAVVREPGPGRPVRVTIDAGDDRPERFWLASVLALERAVPGAFAQAAASAVDVHRLPSEFLGRLLAAWSAVTDPLVIVLDDVHHLRSPEITEDLGFVVEHLPGRSRMLLTSRADPHLPVSRWRGRGSARRGPPARSGADAARDRRAVHRAR